MEKEKLGGLKQSVMLQVNEGLYKQGLISRSVYEQVKIQIVNTVH